MEIAKTLPGSTTGAPPDAVPSAAPAHPSAIAVNTDGTERVVNHGTSFTEAASKLYDGLAEPQRREAVFPFGSPQHRRWQYTPNPSSMVAWTHVLPRHNGTSIAKLSPEQRAQLEAFLDAALSSTGRDMLDAARTLDANDTLAFRGLRDWLLFDYGPENYFVSFFGKPGDAKWGVRIEGHHISYSFDVRDGEIGTSSVFVGTTVPEVQLGARTVRPLAEVVSQASTLAGSLDTNQRRTASQSVESVPTSLLYAPSEFGKEAQVTLPLPPGLRYSDMTTEQQGRVQQIIGRYQDALPPGIAKRNLEAARANGFRDVEFVWAGDPTRREIFYFRVQGEHFILELGCSEGSPEHYHAAWVRTS